MNFDRMRALLWEKIFTRTDERIPLLALENVGSFISGRTPKKEELSPVGDIPYFKVSDMNSSGNEKYLNNTKLYFKEKCGRIYPKNAIVYPKNGGAVFTNKRRILKVDSVVDLNTGGFVCREKVNLEYAYLFFCGLDFKKFSKGTALPTIDQQKLRNVQIPIPPIDEQARIVAKLEQAFAEIDRAEKAYQDLQTLSEVLRKQILQEAIQGKLVPQLTEDGMVEQISEAPEEVPFAIPESWKWMTLETIFKFVDYRGKTPTKSSEGIRLVTASNVKQGFMDHKRIEFISRKEYGERQSRGISQKGDILFTTEAPLGNVAIADLEEFSVGQRVITLQNGLGHNRLLMYFLLSPYFQEQLKNNATGTTAQGIKAAKLKKLYLPVPPVQEQARIVAKVEELMKQVVALSA